jgi:hypothetical protein
MVEPQSPLYDVRSCVRSVPGYEPEKGRDLASAVGRLLMLLWSSLGDLEPILAVESIARIGRSGDLAAVVTVAKDLYRLLALSQLVEITAYLCLTVTLHLIADISTHTSSDRHVGCDAG